MSHINVSPDPKRAGKFYWELRLAGTTLSEGGFSSESEARSAAQEVADSFGSESPKLESAKDLVERLLCL